jgi:hypothetical protein
MVEANNKGYLMQFRMVKDDDLRFRMQPAFLAHDADGQPMYFVVESVDNSGSGMCGSLVYHEQDGSFLYYSLDAAHMAGCWMSIAMDTANLGR